MGFWDSVKKLFGGEKAPEAEAPKEERAPDAPPQDPQTGGAYRSAPQKQKEPKQPQNPYGQSPVMGFSEADVRKRFFEMRRGGITPYFHPDLITGLAAQNRDDRAHFRAYLQGKLAYLAMVDRDKGMAMLKQLAAVTD